MNEYRCTMPTRTLRSCSRSARYLYIIGDGTSERPANIIAAYCAQHERAGGHARMLRPRPWEYTEKVDIVAHVLVTS